MPGLMLLMVVVMPMVVSRIRHVSVATPVARMP